MESSSDDEESFWEPPTFTVEDWRSVPPPAPKPAARPIGAPAARGQIGTTFTFDRVRDVQCESDAEYRLSSESKEGSHFLHWASEALREARRLMQSGRAPHCKRIDELAGQHLSVVRLQYVQLKRVQQEDEATGVYTPYEKEGKLHCINPLGKHYELLDERVWPFTFRMTVAGESEFEMSCCKLPHDYSTTGDYLSPTKPSTRVILIDCGPGDRIYISKREIVDKLSKHTAWFAAKRLPSTDKEAFEELLNVAGDDWRTLDNCIFVFEDGIWTERKAAFRGLMMRHSDLLGSYGEMAHKMASVETLAKTANVVGSEWTQRFNRLGPGLVPFSDGIYDIVTRELRDIEREDMLTFKFDISSPSSPSEGCGEEMQQLNSMLDDLLPEEGLRVEVLTRLAESLFSCTNTHKYFVQLYGEGNNGKTTLMRILQTALPQWVKMPNVEHLVSRKRDPTSPQGWLIEAMGSRILGFEEPPPGSKFDGALLKLLRGNGVVTGRALYKCDVSYVPGFTIWIATNSPVEVEPTDQAVLSSFHSFQMPSYFVDDGCAVPIGTRFVKKKVPNIEQRFERREHKLALLNVLRGYYMRYRSIGLPPLVSTFSSTLTSIYKEEHPRIDAIFDGCIVEKSGSQITAKRLLEVMQMNGYDGGAKKLKIFTEERFKSHTFVKKTAPKNVPTWKGLHADDQFGQFY